MPHIASDTLQSHLSFTIDGDGVGAEVCIYRNDEEKAGWMVEVTNRSGLTIVCEQVFESDSAAYLGLLVALENEVMKRFVFDDGFGLSSELH